MTYAVNSTQAFKTLNRDETISNNSELFLNGSVIRNINNITVINVKKNAKEIEVKSLQNSSVNELSSPEKRLEDIKIGKIINLLKVTSRNNKREKNIKYDSNNKSGLFDYNYPSKSNTSVRTQIRRKSINLEGNRKEDLEGKCSSIMNNHSMTAYLNTSVQGLKTENKKSLREEILLQVKRFKDLTKRGNINDHNVLSKPPLIFNYMDQEYFKKLEKEFLDKTNLCVICCKADIQLESSVKFDHHHTFCLTCTKIYSENLIKNGQYEIKCMYSNCNFYLNPQNIKEIVDENIYEKYLGFKKYKENKKIAKKLRYIPCVFPDCDQYVNQTEKNKFFVKCLNKHEFCTVCKTEHSDMKIKCSKFKIEIETFSNLKLCKGCGEFMEKDELINITHCVNCKQIYCWLCTNEYSQYHFELYNIFGCPGRKFVNLKHDSIWNNYIFLLLFYVFVIFYGFLYCVALTFFAFPYMLLKFYFKKLLTNGYFQCNFKYLLGAILITILGILVQPTFWPIFLIYFLFYRYSKRKLLCKNSLERKIKWKSEYTISIHITNFFNISFIDF